MVCAQMSVFQAEGESPTWPSIGPNCRELCGACFEKARPLEESTVGGIIGDDPKFHERCDACGKYAPRSDMHHVHMGDHALVALRRTPAREDHP